VCTWEHQQQSLWPTGCDPSVKVRFSWQHLSGGILGSPDSAVQHERYWHRRTPAHLLMDSVTVCYTYRERELQERIISSKIYLNTSLAWQTAETVSSAVKKADTIYLFNEHSIRKTADTVINVTHSHTLTTLHTFFSVFWGIWIPRPNLLQLCRVVTVLKAYFIE